MAGLLTARTPKATVPAGENVMLSGPLRWAIILIGAAIALNYIDRGAVSVAAPLIKDEFGLTNERYGVIVSSFYWTYVPALALAGWLAFGEMLGPLDIFGGMLVGAALVLIRLPNRRAAPI